jgi:iron complex outermembrane receptor protein
MRGGMRYEYFDLTVEDFVRPVAYAFQGIPFVLPDLRVSGGNFTYSSPTFNLGGTYKITNAVELHGGFSQGYALPDIGGFTRRAGLSPAYACTVASYTNGTCLNFNRSINYSNLGIEPQIVNSYELGLRWSGPTFRGNVVGFVSTSDMGVTFDPARNAISQQKEKITGVEGTGEVTISPNLNVGTVLAYREGRYDTNRDAILDSYLPNNRIATPFHGTIYADYRFDNGAMLRVEGMGFSGRDRKVNLAGNHYKLESGEIMNVSLGMPVWGGTAYVGVQNVFDWNYQNPTASSVRELAPTTTSPVYAFGRMVSLGFRKTW